MFAKIQVAGQRYAKMLQFRNHRYGSLYICYWIPAVGVSLIALWHSTDVLLAENSPPYEPRSELSAGLRQTTAQHIFYGLLLT